MQEYIASANSFLGRMKYFGFLLLVYVFIYNPSFSFLPLTPLELMLIPAFIYITVYSRWTNLFRIFKNEILVLFAIVCFCFFREFGGQESVFFKANIFFLLQTIVLPYFVISLYSNLRRHNNLIKDIMLLGIIASFITIVMLVFPGVADVIRYNLLKTDDFTVFITFRSFGISEGLTFAYGTTQGLIFALIIYYSKFDARYLLFLPFILISILFNARIGLVPVIFSLFYFVIIKFNVKFMTIFAVIGFILYFLIFNTELFSEYAKTIEWAFDFFVQSSNFIAGNKSSSAESNTLDILFGEMAVLPKDLMGWIVGSGESIYTSKEANSDIGYLIQLNYGGIVYISGLFFFVGILMWRLKFLYKENRWLIFLFLFTIILTNVKGLFISIIPSFRLIMLIYCYLVVEYTKLKKGDAEKINLLNPSGKF